jgi:signal transduction histidine kinase
MSLKSRLKTLITSNNPDENQNRRELILNILLSFSLAGFLALNIIRVSDYFIYEEKRGLPLWWTLAILAFFAFLFWLSKKGWIRLASVLLIITYSLPMFYSLILWGADLPAGLLLAVLIITLSGVLLSARVALVSTSIISVFLIFITDWQAKGIIAVQSYWRQEKMQISDAISYIILLSIITVVAWLFCRGINKALLRAQKSEKELKQERDSLEIKVAERTQQLRQTEAEKINQLYRLAEFGRLSSGIFHDLINPLTAVSLNLEQIRGEAVNKISSAKSYLSQALLATHKMEGLIAGIKKQIQQESNLTTFSTGEEIEQIIQILAYKARRANVSIDFREEVKIKLYGDAIKFGQIISNLLANAIEASEINESQVGINREPTDINDRKVKIILEKQRDMAIISVSDQGHGISPEHIDKIFEPFFSTKKENGRGLGLGLASAKNITEKDFSGTIIVSSQLGQGSLFTVTLPLKQN